MTTESQTTVEPAFLAVPASGEGPGVLVLHAWWGLNDFFKGLCDRLARAGFVAAAPDLYDGRTAATVDEAEQMVGTLNFQASMTKVLGTLESLRRHPAVRGDGQGVVGFSLGGAWALRLSTLKPEAVRAVVVFYGTEAADFSLARAAYLGHFAPGDEWEPDEGVRQMEANLRAAGHEVEFRSYPGTGHWFFEANRPEHYKAEAAALAWQRTVEFLRRHLA